jgi:hypothetical protein
MNACYLRGHQAVLPTRRTKWAYKSHRVFILCELSISMDPSDNL